MRENVGMTIQKLYELLSKRLDDMDARHTKQLDDMDARHTQRLNDMDAHHTQRLDDMDARHTQRLDDIDTWLRGVGTGIAELRGRKAGFTVLKDWIVAICAVAALIVSIIALTH